MKLLMASDIKRMMTVHAYDDCPSLQILDSGAGVEYLDPARLSWASSVTSMLGMGRYEDDVDTDVGIGGCGESELSDSDSDGDE